MTRIYAISAAALVAALLGGLMYFVLVDRGDAGFAQCRGEGVTVAGETLGGPFEMVDQHGDTVTDADVITQPSLIYFGYTFCPDVCPIDVDRNAVAVDMLRERGYDAKPVFITVDPDRDTPEVLEAYAANMHEDMIALTGTADQVRETAQAYRAFYRKHESGDDFYLVDHSTFSYLVLPGHGFVEVFRRDMPPDDLADQVSCFIDAA